MEGNRKVNGRIPEGKQKKTEGNQRENVRPECSFTLNIDITMFFN